MNTNSDRRSSGAPHPRRPPAHKSVSLRHSPPASQPSVQHQHHPSKATTRSSLTGPASDKANPPSSVSPQVASKQSSGESSDAGKWFESTNNNVGRSNPSFGDNDEPPFFLRNSSSSSTPPDGQDPRTINRAQPTDIPYRPGLNRFDTEGSSTEDFRSVIDDLTIANKKLKQRLRKYEKLYDAHLQDEKLFEVRFHGLPDHKKKELEETLRKFAVDLDPSTNKLSPAITYAPALGDRTASSHTSRFAESGYASMSASGQNSSSAAASGQESNYRKTSKAAFNRQQENVHSYLHDIPAGLLPKHNVPMTEKSRKKIVVRRLEQIFAGKLPTPGSHPQPLQQQEVAQSAAMADLGSKQASGQPTKKEGLREARIMPKEDDNEVEVEKEQPPSLRKLRPYMLVPDRDQSGSGSPDQRPTRPLDLDPYRAQIPAENMEYIRHLGFTPPNMLSGDASDEGHGWIYLNVLVNMAQLHTINVTLDFVKSAVLDYSDKFELSHDGRKVRWKGGHDVTRTSSDSSSDQLSGASPYYSNATKSPSKQLKTDHSGSGSSSVNPERRARRLARAAKERDQNRLAYTPLFFHKDESDDEDDFFNPEFLSSSNSPLPRDPQGNSSGLGSSAMRSSSSRKRRQEGPLIFYNNAKFCTDLAGDRNGFASADPASYKSITTQPVGVLIQNASSMAHITEVEEAKGPLEDPSLDLDTDPMEIDQSASSDEDIDFSLASLQNNSDESSFAALEFEATGLGGVQPEDNFAINVNRRQQYIDNPGTVAFRQTAAKSRHYSNKIADVLKGKSDKPGSATSAGVRPVIAEQIISAKRKDLPRSTLPPASFLPFDSTSSGDVDSDSESDASSSHSGDSEEIKRTALQLLNVSPTHTTRPYPGMDYEEDTSSEEDEEGDDDSIDLLATARALDPVTIHASELEYNSNIADRLAEEIPAGSSAATAGGGSGFNSPQSLAAGDDGETTKRPSTSGGSCAVSRLKRSRTNDSIAAALQRDVKAMRTSP